MSCIGALSQAAKQFGDVADQADKGLADQPSPGVSPQPIQPDKKNWNSACNDFIKKNSEFGKVGTFIKALLYSGAYPKLFSGEQKDWGKICPTFPKMSLEDKENFLVWFTASVAMAEGSCQSGAKNPNAPDDKAVGMFQYPRHGSPFCRSSHVVDKIMSTRCFLGELNSELAVRDTILDYDKNHRTTYWQVLHAGPQSAKLLKLLNQYQKCH
jgi:hypothetical protein